MRKWGYPKDEFVGNGYWSHQLYVREARRMLGEVVMTQQHCVGKKTCDDGIGWAAYTMDSHNCDRHVINGFVKNEGNVEVGGFKPYPISYRCIVPPSGRSQESSGTGLSFRFSYSLWLYSYGTGFYGTGTVIGSSGQSRHR